MSEKNVSKFILTVEVGEEQVSEVEETLVAVAESMHARLTRSDWEPAETPGYHRKVRTKKLRAQGFLA